MSIQLEERLSSALGAESANHSSQNWDGLADQTYARVARRTRLSRAGFSAALIALAVGGGAAVATAQPDTTPIDVVAGPTNTAAASSAVAEAQSVEAAAMQSMPRVEIQGFGDVLPGLIVDALPRAIVVIAVAAAVLAIGAWIRRRRMSRPLRLPGKALLTIVTALVVAISVFTWVFDVFWIPGGSMSPTIEAGDRVLTVRGERGANVGDIVIFTRPEGTGGFGNELIKRVIAVEGETFEVTNGRAFVNGGAVRFVPDSWDVSQIVRESPVITIPEGHVFVVGDNSRGSTDSRDFGPIPVDSINGTVRWVTGGLPTVVEN